ncbi:MAG TPA: MFS transporter [Stellaceae bacterium]|nr:MFS transporter [Stellaceae bacterium]
MNLALLALALASFGIGTTEFVIMGLLPDVAHDLDVTIPQAGLLVTGYALGVTFLSPFLALATAKLKRHQALISLTVVFTIGNLLCAVAPSYDLLMAARIVTALSHGAFFGLGSVVAAQIVAPERRAQAIAMMFMGLTLANVMGVPAGTILGQALGWRSTFWAVVLIGIIACLALRAWLPRDLPVTTLSLRQELGVLGRRQVLLAMAISVLASASLFTTLTYIAPLLEIVTKLSPHAVSLVLLLFGAGLTLGNLGGGKLGDWRIMPTLVGIFSVLILLLMAFSHLAAAAVPAILLVFFWGVLAFALVSPLQMRVLNEAAGAPNLASTINQGAFNFGNATGAWIGGIAIDRGMPYMHIPWIGAAVAALALVLTLYSWRLDRSLPAAAQ